MSASSLIFVVVLAVWAAYMLQHWVRRREDLATARSVDRFSEAMRMLERRTPVKADVTTRPEEPKRPLLGAQAMVKRVSVKGSSSSGAAAVDAEPAARPARSGARPSLSSPEVKVGVLLTSLVFFVLTALLAPFGVVPGWMPLLGVVAVGGVVYWLRRSAIAARSAKRSRSTARVTPIAPAAAAAQTARAVKAPVVATTSAAEPKRSPLVAAKPAEAASVEPAEDEVVFDQQPEGATAKRAEAEVFDARRWAPVDVPRPTYTMKAKAERDEVAPAATVDQTDARSAAVPAESLDSRPLAARYENTPVAELPFDGMALDEDYDDLPQVFRAG